MRNTFRLTLAIDAADVAGVTEYLQKHYDQNCIQPFRMIERHGKATVHVASFPCKERQAISLSAIAKKWPKANVFSAIDDKAKGQAQKRGKMEKLPCKTVGKGEKLKKSDLVSKSVKQPKVTQETKLNSQ